MRTNRLGAVAALVLVSPILVAPAVAQQFKRGGGGGGGAPHVAAPAPHIPAPAPHVAAPAPRAAAPHFSPPAPRAAAPHFAAPHVAAPHVSAPRAAPHFAAPRAAPHIAAPRAGPHIATPRAPAPHFARGRAGPHAPAGAAQRNAGHNAGPAQALGHNAHGPRQVRPTERSIAGGGRERQRGGPPNAVGQAPGKPNSVGQAPGKPSNVGQTPAELRNARGRGERPGTVGQGPAGRNLAGGLGPSQQAHPHRILRNTSLTNLSPRDRANRSLRESTFRGRYAHSGFARDFGDRSHRHRHLGFVLGFVGGLFWPYAYGDFVDYTYYPSAYDTFWPYAYDDVFVGLYGGYAPEYGAAYEYAGAPASSRSYARLDAAPGNQPGGQSGGGAMAQICSGDAKGLTDFPIERIAEQVQPTQDQQALLNDLKGATVKAVQILQAACPNDLPGTPTGRLTATRARVSAMLQAVQTVRPALDKFYASLSDEQKQRFNALDQGDVANASASRPQRGAGPSVAQLCDSDRRAPASPPSTRIRQSLQLSETQDADLRALDDASAKAAEMMNASCSEGGQALTPTGRVTAMEQRLQAMLQAIDAVRPALTKFYGSLSDEQKARFDRLGSRRT